MVDQPEDGNRLQSIQDKIEDLEVQIRQLRDEIRRITSSEKRTKETGTGQ